MSHFGPPDSIRRRVERPLSREGASSFSEPARRAGRPFTRLSGLSHRGRETGRGRPLLHEALLLGSRNALRTTEHAGLVLGTPFTMSHFGPPDSIRRRVERPLSREGAWPSFSEPARRAGRPFTRLSGLSHRGRERQGEAAFARSASARLQKCPPHHRTRRNPENRDLEASSWGPPHDEPFRATRQHSTTRGEAPFQRGGGLAQISEPATRAGSPFTRLACNNAGGGSYLRGSHSLKGAEEGKAGLLRAPWPRKAFWGPGKGAKRGCQPPQKSQASPL